MNDFARILEDAGGASAPPDRAARLRTALQAELDRGASELGQPRSGYGDPLIVAFSPEHAILPVPATLRADPLAAPERAWLLTAAAVGALIEAGASMLEAGAWHGHLVLTASDSDPELAVLAFGDHVTGIDRLRARAVEIPDVVAPEDVRPPANPTLAVAQRVARAGGRPADQHAVEDLAGDATARPHDDPDPSLRAARRILQRLRGMGKWGGYHTEFAHLAKGFPGHERALALDVGEALLAAGLLTEKPSVGQRHVFLDPGRAADIHALIDDGVTPAGLVLP